MGAKAAVGILHRKKLRPAGEREALHAQLAEEHERIAGGVNRALQIGVVDEVVEPSLTRRRLVAALLAARLDAARTATSRCNPERETRHRRGRRFRARAPVGARATDRRCGRQEADFAATSPMWPRLGGPCSRKRSSGRRFPDGARTTGLRLRRSPQSGGVSCSIVTLLRPPGGAR